MTEDASTAVHLFEIIETVVELDAVRVGSVQFDLGALVNDLEVCTKTVAGFVILCAKSKKARMFEMASSTLGFIVKKNCMNKGKLVSESSAVRNYKAFFDHLASELHDIFNAHLQDFLILYDSQCYGLRNALTEIIKQIIIRKCGQFDNNEKVEELGGNTETLRKELTEWIVQRTRDKSSFCRHKAIGDLCDLMVNKMLSRENIDRVFEVASKQIKDPNSHVRKKSMVLCSEIVTFYISTMTFPEEESIDRELAEIRARKQEYEKKSAPGSSLEERESHLEQIGIAIKYEGLLEFYRKTFIILGGLLPQVVSLMFRSSTDSLEAIRLLVKMKTLGYHRADVYFPKMYTLVWSEDKNIVEEIKASFISLYVAKDRKQNACKNICQLLKMCDKSTKVCVLRVIRNLFEDAEKNARQADPKSRSKYYLEEDFIPLFWNFFIDKVIGYDPAGSMSSPTVCCH